MKKLSLALTLILALVLTIGCFSASAKQDIIDPDSAGVAMFQKVEGYGYTWSGENSRYQTTYNDSQSAVQSGWKYCPIAIYKDGYTANFITISTSSMGVNKDADDGLYEQYKGAKVYYSDTAWAEGTDLHWRKDPLSEMTEVPVELIAAEGPGYIDLFYKFAGSVTGKTFIIVWADGENDGGHLNFTMTACGYDDSWNTAAYTGTGSGSGSGSGSQGGDTGEGGNQQGGGQQGGNNNAGTADFAIVSVAVAAVAVTGIALVSKKRR